MLSFYFSSALFSSSSSSTSSSSREAAVELAVLAARGLAADGLEQVALGGALRLAGVHARVEVAPVTALEGSCAAALTAWPNMSTFRIHLSCLLSS